MTIIETALRKIDECIRINKLQQTSGVNLTKWNRVVNTLFHARTALLHAAEKEKTAEYDDYKRDIARIGTS